MAWTVANSSKKGWWVSGKRFVILTASEQLPAKLAVASLPEVERLGEQFTNQLTLSVVNVFPLRGKAWPPWLPFQASFPFRKIWCLVTNRRKDPKLGAAWRLHLQWHEVTVSWPRPPDETLSSIGSCHWGMREWNGGNGDMCSHSSQMKKRSKSTGSNVLVLGFPLWLVLDDGKERLANWEWAERLSSRVDVARNHGACLQGCDGAGDFSWPICFTSKIPPV